MKKENPPKTAGGYEQAKSKYTLRFLSLPTKKRLMVLAALVVGAALFVTIASFVGGGNYVVALISMPASALIFAMLVGLAEMKREGSDSIPLRERYSPSNRYKLAGVLLVVSIITVGVLSRYFPYSVGGTIVLTIAFLLLNFVRLSPEESYREKEGIPDPHDYATIDSEIDDDVDFVWEEDEDDIEEEYKDDPTVILPHKERR